MIQGYGQLDVARVQTYHRPIYRRSKDQIQTYVHIPNTMPMPSLIESTF